MLRLQLRYCRTVTLLLKISEAAPCTPHADHRSATFVPAFVCFRPGCSSLEGAFQESGPLWTTAGGNTLELNDYSWNKFAHTLYLEVKELKPPMTLSQYMQPYAHAVTYPYGTCKHAFSFGTNSGPHLRGILVC